MLKDNLKKILSQLPAGVQLVAAAKARSVAEVKQAIEAGVKIIGENYVREAEDKFKVIGRAVKWHFIGHLQSNKVKQAVNIFDMIQTLDTLKIARQIGKACELKKRIMPVLIEINSAREKQKFGLLPEEVECFIKEASMLRHIKIMGLMTMGPFLDNAEQLRPFFTQTCQLFERIKSLNLPGVEMRILSMGMSDSYRIAIQEGANLVRVGTAIFGSR